MARVPHGYFEPGVIARDVAAGGFVNAPRIEWLAARSRAASAQAAAIAYCQGTPMRNEIESRTGGSLSEVTAACAAAIAARFGAGSIEGKIQGLVVNAEN
jgi:hypothetical protein